jgi:hypothetical protein
LKEELMVDETNEEPTDVAVSGEDAPADAEPFEEPDEAPANDPVEEPGEEPD